MSARHQYDPRLREAIHRSQNPGLFSDLGVPRSTIASWLNGDFLPTVTSPLLSMSEVELIQEVERLRRRVEWLTALVRLLVVLVRVSGARLDDERLPDGLRKARVLRIVESVRGILGLNVAIRVLGLSPARYHRWKALGRACSLDDRPSCPRMHPNQLIPEEVRAIHQMVTAPEYRHMALRTLALHAQRLGRVFASPRTWMKLVRDRGWRRPRTRLYPPKPRLGVRANRPNDMWHVDVTIIRLLDHKRLYLHGVIDNYSRKILAWRLVPRLDPLTTCEVLLEAGSQLAGTSRTPTSVVVDGGRENKADLFADLLGGALKRVLAQVDVSWSNSMIEAWWRSLKHQWLYLHDLSSESEVRRLVAFFVEQHNDVMPHYAFEGRTPSEVHDDREIDLPERLAERRIRARRDRLLANQATSCSACDPAALAVA